MSVYKKLQQARVDLQSTTMKKSGHNKFAGYSYFELGDFLPAIQKIFNNIGLCGIVSFGKEEASLLIIDIDDGSNFIITSPMSEANLKGCHPIQNLGAVETYTRRYLWVTAMEIVEHDALDSAPPVEEKIDLEPITEAMKKASSKEELKEAYLKAKKAVGGNAAAIKELNELGKELALKFE